MLRRYRRGARDAVAPAGRPRHIVVCLHTNSLWLTPAPRAGLEEPPRSPTTGYRSWISLGEGRMDGAGGSEDGVARNLYGGWFESNDVIRALTTWEYFFAGSCTAVVGICVEIYLGAGGNFAFFDPRVVLNARRVVLGTD